MSDITTKSERESLEAHVDLCSQRYRFLEQKLEDIKKEFREDIKVVHDRIDRVKDSINDMRESSKQNHEKQNQIIITSAIAIVVALMGGIFTLLSKM